MGEGKQVRHCEERSDAAIHLAASLAMPRIIFLLDKIPPVSFAG
jgi:hypothetical protein